MRRLKDRDEDDRRRREGSWRPRGTPSRDSGEKSHRNGRSASDRAARSTIGGAEADGRLEGYCGTRTQLSQNKHGPEPLVGPSVYGLALLIEIGRATGTETDITRQERVNGSVAVVITATTTGKRTDRDEDREQGRERDPRPRARTEDRDRDYDRRSRHEAQNRYGYRGEQADS